MSEPTSDQALPAISPATKRSNHTRWSLVAGVVPQPVLDQGEVPAEGLRQVGVDGGELDPQPGELDEVEPAAAGRGRHAQRTEALGLSRRTASTGSSPSSSRWRAPAAMASRTGAHSARSVGGSGRGVVVPAGSTTVGPALGGPDTQGGHG